jgi:hypothetical protein
MVRCEWFQELYGELLQDVFHSGGYLVVMIPGHEHVFSCATEPFWTCACRFQFNQFLDGLFSGVEEVVVRDHGSKVGEVDDSPAHSVSDSKKVQAVGVTER